MKTYINAFKSRFLIKIVVIHFFVLLFASLASSYLTKSYACYLVNQLDGLKKGQQVYFSQTLQHFLILFIGISLVISFIFYIYLAKRLTRPLNDLVERTKTLAEGRRPQKIQNRYEDEIGRLASHFNILIEKLNQNEQVRNKMVSDLSHELRTPLANLIGFMEGLSKGIIEPDTLLFQELMKELERMTYLVNQIQKLKEWDLNVVQELDEWIDIKGLVNETLLLFDLEFQKKELHYFLDLDDAIVRGLEFGLKQVFFNLIDNAIRYSFNQTDIFIKGETRKTDYKFSITNSGERIPDGHVKWLFERFYRVDHSRSRQSGGNGLGLSIVREIVERHGGEAGAETNDGTHTFWFCIPLARDF